MKLTNDFTPLVSLIIPVFNGAKYLKESIESALSQTYDNIEIIVVNDGSTDYTEQICLDFGDKIRYFKKNNGGCASALNLGVKNMNGDYFSWLSHDDVYPVDKLEYQLKYLARLSNKQTILYGPYLLIDTDSKAIAGVHPHLANHKLNKLNTNLYPLYKGLINGCTLLIPKSCFDRFGLFDESLLATQDYDLWLKFLREYSIFYVHKPMVLTRLHPEQSSKKIPTNLEECDSLWIRMIDTLSEQEMLRVENSVYLFFVKTSEFLKTTPYKLAYQHCINKKDQYLDSIKVSVVIPFKDRFEMLLESVDSVKSQTHGNIELILVDDGSDGNLIDHFDIVGQGQNIVYMKQDNAGPASARNNGIQYATGEYIAFLDSDDLFYPEKIRIQLEFMLINEIQITHTSYDRIDIENNQPAILMDSGGVSSIEFPELITQCQIATPTVMGKTELFRIYKFPTDISVGEDVCCWLSIAAKNTFKGISTPLTLVRTRSSSASMQYQKQIVGLLNIARHVASNDDLLVYKDELHRLIDACATFIKG